MKKHGFLFALLAGFTVFFTAGCYINEGYEGNGRIVCREKETDEFDSIVLEGIGDVEVHPGTQYKGKDYAAIVITDSNIQDSVIIDMSGSTLYISERKHSNIRPTKLVIEVYTPELKSVDLEGAGDIKVHKGKTRSLKMKLSGMGNIDAENCQAENVNVTLSGAGNVKTWPEKTLTGKLSGIGDIYYKGNPVKEVEKTGIGKVRQR
jgi:hypothetical protein